MIAFLRGGVNCRAALFIGISFFNCRVSNGQQRSLSIKEVLTLVKTGQPLLQVHRDQASAASYDISLAKNSLVPNLTAGYQAGYATYNNITGMSYPGLIMPISGPPSAGNTYDPVPGTALTALLQWTPFTFGQRQAEVEKALAQFKLAESSYDKALFSQQYAAIAIYLDLLYLGKLLGSQQANIQRTQVGLQQSQVLTGEGLRPGLDTVQFQSLLARSEMDLLYTQRLYQSQALELCRLTGLPLAPEDLLLSDTLMTTQSPEDPDTTGIYATNPDYQYSQAQVALSTASLKGIERAWRPRFDLWANGYARGSGVTADGTVDKAAGWSLSRKNYGAGVQLSFPILQFARVNIQKKQYRWLLMADRSRMSQVSIDLQRQVQTAQVGYRQNLLIVAKAPVLSRAARNAFEGLQLSYHSGLTDFTRLSQGQYELLNAEVMEANAYLQVWRSLLDIGIAKGRLDLFTNQLK